MSPMLAGGAAPRRARRRRIGVSVGLALAVAGATIGPVAPARADKVYPSKSDVSAAQSKAARTRAAVTKLADAINAADQQLQSLQTSAEQAAEAYNAAQVKLQEAQRTAASAQRNAASARRNLAIARDQLGQFAASSYRSGGDLANVGALLSSDGPRTLLDRANTINVLSNQRASVLDRVESARIVADLLDQQSQSALTSVKTATETVRTSKLRAQAAVDNQANQVKALDLRKAALRTQLARLDKNAVRLAEQRASGIRAAAARKAAAEARRAAERRGSGGGGGVPVNAPAGTSISTAAQGRAAVAFAKAQLGSWYLWGGAGPKRFDCSGLTMRGWESAGIQIPRVASWQYAWIEKIPVSSLRPGDLLFYATDLTDYQTIHHVGIYVGGGQMIEAPHTGAKVRYASIWRADLIGAGRP